MEKSDNIGAILKKLHRVMKDVDRIGKDKKNTHGNYNYASEKVIKEVLHHVFVKHGVLLQMSTSDPRLLETKDKAVCMAIDVRYRLFDIESSEWIGGDFVGSGNGRDDKGIYAAMTGAIKYLLTSNFLIPTGDDPESNFFDNYKEEDNEIPESPPKQTTGKEKKPAETIPVASAITAGKTSAPAQPQQASPAAPTGAELTRLTEAQRSVVIDAFEAVGIEIWDLEKVAGDQRDWSMETKRNLLKKYNALTTKKTAYEKEDFLAGKEVV